MSLRASCALLLVALAATACKRKPPEKPPAVAAAPDAGVACPAADALASPLAQPGKVVRAACHVMPMGRYWLAAALVHGVQAPREPRLHLLAGGEGDKVLAFDIEPAPTEVLSKLIDASRDVEVRIRTAKSESSLVRVGVLGHRGTPERPEADEVLVVLQLAAHAPPKLLWMGAGDQISTGEDGCVNERGVDFQMLFGKRLEMFSTSKASRAKNAPKDGPPCQGGMGSQETVAYNPRPLAAGRPLTMKPSAPY